MASQEPLVDADVLLSLTDELRALRDRLHGADIGTEQRTRWQHTLSAIARGAADDLERAQAQLRRLAATVDRGRTTG